MDLIPQTIRLFGHEIALETFKFVVSSSIQFFLGVSASILAWRLGRDRSAKANEELKVKLYDRRYKVFLAFKNFIDDCVVQDAPTSEAIGAFSEGTKRIEFLFGREIVGYEKEVVANALAIVGITSEMPCTSPPSIGGMVGFFPGSTILTNVHDLHAWFMKQRDQELLKYFAPYLDFARAGVDTNAICMRPAKLPDAPLVRRPISKNEYLALTKRPSDDREGPKI
jgi:hypothetical protein